MATKKATGLARQALTVGNRPASDMVHRSLSRGQQWATIPAIVEAVGLTRSQVMRALNELGAMGRVQSRREGRQLVWRKVGISPRLRPDDIPVAIAATIPNAPAPSKRPANRPLRRPAVAAAGEPETFTLPEAPAEPQTASTGQLGEVAGWMEEARPVSAPPAEEPGVRRTRRDPDAPARTFATWDRGGLQAAILTALQELPADADATVTTLAKRLNSHPGAVAYGCERLAVKGNVRRTGLGPRRYAAL